MVKVTTERLPESQVELRIEVEDERLSKAKNSAYKRLASKMKIPGFRPGKAPRELLERHLGEGAILHEALDRLMPQVFQEALEQESIDPIDQAQYELVTEEPLVAKFTVPVRPDVSLGDYQALRLPKETVEVDAERVQEGLEGLRHRYATLEPIERPIAWNDVIRADVAGTLDGEPLLNEEDVEFQLVEGRVISMPGLTEALIGHEKGDEFEVELTVPDDAPDAKLRGKPASYRVTIRELKQEVLPELDDEFAAQVGEGFADLAALRSRVEEDLRAALEQEANRKYEEAVLDALVEGAELEYAPVTVDREVERLLHEEARAGGQQTAPRGGTADREALERHLERIGKSEEELRTELRPIAEKRIQRSLVLSEASEAEHILTTDEEVAAEIDRMATGVGEQADEIRRLFSTDAAKESIKRSLITRRTVERLTEIASSGEAAEEAQADASQEE